MEVKLWYRGRSVTEADIAFIRHLIAEHPTASRRLLSKKLCAAWPWVQPNGALRDMVLLTEQAKSDRDIIQRIKTQLKAGKSVCVTSGFVRAKLGGALAARGVTPHLYENASQAQAGLDDSGQR